MPVHPHTYLPLHRVATALPFMDFLHQHSAPVEHELQQANLPVPAMDDPDCFIPSRNYWNFIANVAAHKNTRNLGFLVGRQSGTNAADPGLARQLVRSPTLHQALDRFCKIASTEISQVALWLVPADRNTHRMHYRTSYSREHPAYVHFQWYGLMAMISTIRLFTGRHWQPHQIGLGTTSMPGQIIRQYFPHARFHTGQEHCFISIGSRLLGKPPQPDEDQFLSSPRYKKIRPPGDFIGAFKLALRSYLRDGTPSIDLAADIADLSTRTLQRRLADRELTYRGLLDQTRFEAATDLLENTDNSITEIAHLLGYSNPTHFTRAFRRVAGVSPSEYLQH